MRSFIRKVNIILLVLCTVFLYHPYLYAQNASTKAEVEFTAGNGPTKPVNPDDPSSEANDDSVGGSLAIVSVSDFDFGEIPVEATTTSYGIKTDTPNIQVVDLRGTGTGWKVTANLSRFTSSSSNTLTGAAIYINDGHPNSLSPTAPPEQKTDVMLTSDNEPVPVIVAKEGAGAGLWVMRWYPPSDGLSYIQLEIPAGVATLGDHSATINWILENTPM